MKLFRLLTLCFIILALSALVSCGGGVRLDTPSGVSVEYETLTLRWDAVKDAKTYTVRIESQGKEPVDVDLSKNYYSLESLTPGKYSISVRASGDQLEDSAFSASVDFERDTECGLEFTLINGTEYEVSGKGQATGDVVIPATYRKKAVTSIGEKAFFNASDVSSVKLPDGIRSIGAFAFANCSYLEKIELPNSLTELGESAFSGCRALSGTLTLPNDITNIPKGAFAYCSSLEGVLFGEKLVSVGENAFTDCADLKSLTFPSSLKSVGGFAFAACSDITEIVFNEGLEYIGEFAFSKLILLSSVNLPDSLKAIGRGAFYYSSALSDMTLGEKIEEIGDSAFLDTEIYKSSVTNEIYVGNWFIALKDNTAPTLNVKEGTVGIADSALYANQYLTSVELPDSVKYIGKRSFAGSNIVSIVTGGGVERISDEAFLYCVKLIDAVLGSYDYENQEIKSSSLESIGNYAFMNCSALQRIKIPSTVKDIGSYAFRNTEMFNRALTGAVYADNWIVDFNKTIGEELVVDKGTVGIARYAFYNCQTLKSINIDNSVKFIGKGAFYNCTSLEKVVFPDTLEKIEDYTFYSCTALRLTSLPPMLREIGKSAFYLCGRADNYAGDTDSDMLEIPAGVTYIGDFAFYGCGYRDADSVDGDTATSGIDIIVIGSGVEYIGKGAFREFASLKSVIIGGTEMIGDRAFYGCASLEDITVKNGLLSIGNKAFYKCGELKTAVFPDTLCSVGNYAFYKCEALTELYLGKSLESIGNFAFYGNILLKELNIPATVVSIGDQAFRDCESLASLTLGKALGYVGAHAFYSCDVLTLYADSEINTSGWSDDWNSTFAPVVWGCDVSADGYVSAVKGSEQAVYNNFSDTVISAPTREGYIFLGWSKNKASSTAEQALSDVADLKNGDTFYSVWKSSR